MINLMIHTPVNTRARITEYVREIVPELAAELNEEIIISSPHDFERTRDLSESWLINCIQDHTLPDLVLTHASEFAVLDGKDIKAYFSTWGGEYTRTRPVRSELAPFMDDESIFYPLFIVPIVLCYDEGEINIGDLEKSWEDLLNPAFKAVVTDRSKPITKIVGAHFLKTSPEKFKQFDDLDRIYSPREVMKSVFAKDYELAITNAAFATIARRRGVAINPTREGVMILPQVVALKKGADQRLLKVIDHLLDDGIQNYLGENGFFPANANAVMGETIALNGKIQEFRGWGSYVKEILAYEKRIGAVRSD
jgi:hypothetical protein